MNLWIWSIDGWIVLTGVLSACSCALPGNYLVLRRQSLMGDAISHAVLPGLAAAFLLSGTRESWAMFAGAVIVGVLAAVCTQAITRLGKVEEGAAMGVVFTLFFAVGLILIRRAADHVDLDPDCVLYGNLAQVPLFDGVVPPVVLRLAGVLLVSGLFVGLFYKEMRITSFDPELAGSLGLSSGLMHYVLMVLVAVTAVANFEAVGSILVIAMLIVPGATAHLLTDRLGWFIVLSLATAIVSAVGGHLLALYLPILLGLPDALNTAAMMTVTGGGLFLAALAFGPEYGLAARLWHRLRLAARISREDILGILYRHAEEAGLAVPLGRDRLLATAGSRSGTRRRVTRLRRAGLVQAVADPQGGPGYVLTPAGHREAVRLIGAHRLWETYLAEHFDLPPDHLHPPAERMEHFLDVELRGALREQFEGATADPQGKPIPVERRGEEATGRQSEQHTP